MPTREGGHKVKVGGTVKKFSGASRWRESAPPLTKSLGAYVLTSGAVAERCRLVD